MGNQTLGKQQQQQQQLCVRNYVAIWAAGVSDTRYNYTFAMQTACFSLAITLPANFNVISRLHFPTNKKLPASNSIFANKLLISQQRNNLLLPYTQLFRSFNQVYILCNFIHTIKSMGNWFKKAHEVWAHLDSLMWKVHIFIRPNFL